MTIIATNISEKASETIKKFCTVRKGRNVNIDNITRIFPHIHNTTILERISTTGIALRIAIGRMNVDDDAVVVLSKFKIAFVVDDDILKF